MIGIMLWKYHTLIIWSFPILIPIITESEIGNDRLIVR